MSECAQLGAEIRRQREQAGYSPEAFAAKIGIPPFRYAPVERSECTIFLSTIERVAHGLGVQVSELFRGAGL